MHEIAKLPELPLEQRLNALFDIYESKEGNSQYLGEPITKVNHSLQCAVNAERAGADEATILGAFLHDVANYFPEDGHDALYADDGQYIGIRDHGKAGADYLIRFGFDEDVANLARWHVEALRYLCYKHANSYTKNVSYGSTQAMMCEGGPMSPVEAAEFEDQPYFKMAIQMRKWDEAAKDPNWNDLPSTRKYRDMAEKYLKDKAC